ncbi:GTP-binding protein Era [Owenweeksia hongkongensis DSM 17368]|uniref:GTPase Era n=1 Tax=Owenweeksia hongkongensis (strain DSM 17368 / CIP 108786 / JCM 12287 / NRRL B-23963 / UST20020801) TaxID=926562 RepID=G8R0U0_OWEHD|nr:GTPase Era [Owenweeksia hongkongensis]AEV33817.1 GTP-binding protein Era [Owenweeksia hongkongensis DSM 17368]
MHKSGYVNIIGNPNVGKSTLMNSFLGEDLSIMTPKAQTTRHRILGLLNDENYQIVFSDTPGIIQPGYALQEHMMDFVQSTFEDADIFLFLTEPTEKPIKDERFLQKLQNTKVPVLLIINKIDLTDQQTLEKVVAHWGEQLPNAEIYPISALNDFNTEVLLDRILELLPEGPAYFSKEELSDKDERFFVSEMIREQMLKIYSKEIPYAVQVEVEEFKEEEKIIRIRSIIYVERDTQKSIVIGHQGKMIKRTGTDARIRMEAFFKKKVFLELFVKVRKNWRQSEDQLKRFGYR